MNLVRARKTLRAVQRCENRHIRVTRPSNAADVQEMVREGLLDATLNEGAADSATVIQTITDAGRRFLQIFPPGYRLCQAR